MLEHQPPRRDPRVLVLLLAASEAHVAALDAWDVRGVGRLPYAPDASLRLELVRVLLKARPSFVLVAELESRPLRGVLPVLLDLVTRRGLPLRHVSPRTTRRMLRHAPSAATLRDRYVELRALTRSTDLRALRLAARILIEGDIPSRHYVPRLPPRPAPSMASPRA